MLICMTRDHFKKIRAIRGTFHAKIGTITDRNGKDLIEVETMLRSFFGVGAGVCVSAVPLPGRTLQTGAGWFSLGFSWDCAVVRGQRPDFSMYRSFCDSGF